MNREREFYKTVVLSDIHLGTTHSKVEELGQFLKSIDCQQLILNGDIIDGWHLRKSGLGQWKSKHTTLIKTIMKMMENHWTEIIYVRGNHDDFIEAIAPLNFGKIKVVRDMV